MQAEISNQQRVANTLILNASLIDNLGLMHGKMGISILFYRLARKTNNKIYEDYAGELIDEIYKEITADTPADFENGLAGIGWGIEYLVQNKFIEADTDEVLEEFDKRIFNELNYNAPQKIGLLNGLLGIGTYFLKRIQYPISRDDKIPNLANKQVLIFLLDQLDSKTQNIEEILKEPEKHPFANSDKIFDIMWDLPLLLIFLAEVYQLNLFNFKVSKIVLRILEALSLESKLPKLDSNNLTLFYALLKFKDIKQFPDTPLLALEKDIHKFKFQEVKYFDRSLRYGKSGVELLNDYFLHDLPKNDNVKNDRELNDAEMEHLLFPEGNSQKRFGILEGLAGRLIFNVL